MARTPSEATRFTATGPYVSAKPQSTSPGFSSNPPTFSASTPTPTGSRLPIGATPPSNETAQQKIARLRAAAQATKKSAETPGDRVVRLGRLWADRAHRITAIGLIGLTVVSGAVATAGITDMLMHNRRRRNEWLQEQQVKHGVLLEEARRAVTRGEADEDMVLLLNRERAAQEAAEAKKNRPGVLKRATSWITGEKTAAGEGARKTEAPEVPVLMPTAGTEEVTPDVLHALEEKATWKAATARREKFVGGLLDRQAQAAVDKVSDVSSNWIGWLRGSRS